MTNIDATAHRIQQQFLSWKLIPWDKVVEHVRKLQMRIAKACKDEDLRKVKSLQRLLQKSYYAKLLAVRRVTTNKGSKTPGVDKVVWKSPEAKLKAANQLGEGNYIPLPLRRLYILKKNGKKRPLGLPAMKDRAMQALHLLTLEPISESSADKHSYGFRRCRSTADAIQQCFNVLYDKHAAQYILEGDIKACFDEISHEWMLKAIPMDKTVLRKMLKAGYMEDNAFYKTEAGTPQGGIISPTLANMVLDGIEDLLQTHFGRKLAKHKIHFIRYADDFIITANSKELLENEVKPLLAVYLNGRGLRLSEEKTIVTHIETGFDFLGQTIRKFKGKLISKPSDKSLKSILDKVREICKGNKQAKTADIIRKLNPIIKGWAMYHRHVASGRTFSKVDHEIFQMLWRWAKRRHPNKGLRWVAKKYFKTHKGNRWTFSGKTEEGTSLHLLCAAQIRWKRHIKIRHDANPFDPSFERYFEQREKMKLLGTWNGQTQAKYILEKQGNLCSLCGGELPAKYGWEYHFQRPWMLGGTSQTTNLVIVHPNCHEQIHARCDNKPGQ